MSFFFSKQKAKPAKKRYGASIIPKANSKETLNRLGCKACPLDKANNSTPKMAPDLVKHTDIYILGDKPNEIDDEKGAPFTGKIGKLLRGLLDPDLQYSFDHAVRDYDHHRDTPEWVALECCRSLVTASIVKSRPRLIVGLGVLPLQWMRGSSDMVGLRGRLFAVNVGGHACYFLPTYHPDQVIEHAYDKAEPLRSKLGHCLKFDLERAARFAIDLDPPVIDTPQGARAGVQAFNGHGNGHLGQVLALISEARRAPEKAIDLETSHLRPYAANAKVLTCAISFKNTNFAFALDHPKSGFTPTEIKTLKISLKNLLSDATTIIAHNAPFEVEWLVHLLGKDTIFHDVWECTMMQAHFLDERRGKRGGNDTQFQPNPYQALDFLVRQYFGLSYKSLFKLDRKNMSGADLEETLLYNGADTKYTLRLFILQKRLLNAHNLLHAYEEARIRQPAVALMQSLGIDIDQAQNKIMQNKLGGQINDIEARIRATPEVKDFVAQRKTFNPASNPDVIKIFKEYIKVGKQLINSEGKDSVDKSTLTRIKHPLAKQIEQHRNRSHLKSTYVDPFELGKGAFMYPDGKIHPTCNTTFAETGRTSSDSPNNQNWPKRNDEWLRRQIVARKGYVLVAFDFGQLEACTAAMCTRDKVLVKALWEDYDIHMEWTQKAAKIYPPFIERFGDPADKATFKRGRSVIKNKLVFPVIFGASNTSVARYLDMPQEYVDRLMKEFWQTFYGLNNWQKRVMHDYYNSGFVSSPTGRRRHYPLSKNQAVNHPIQSVACDIVCRGMVTLSERAAETGNWHLHPIMNIHDDLTFIIPDAPDILESSIETIYRAMLTPGYEFINVPLSVSCSVGNNWLEMDEVGKFWSHRDV